MVLEVDYIKLQNSLISNPYNMHSETEKIGKGCLDLFGFLGLIQAQGSLEYHTQNL